MQLCNEAKTCHTLFWSSDAAAQTMLCCSEHCVRCACLAEVQAQGEVWLEVGEGRTKVAMLGRSLAMKSFRLRQREAGHAGAPAAQPVPGPRLLGRRPTLAQPRLQASCTGFCIPHPLPFLLERPLKARVLYSHISKSAQEAQCQCLSEDSHSYTCAGRAF